MKIRGVLASIALLVVTGNASAEPLPEPKVDYTATRVMEMEQGTISGKVYASGGKERSEIDMQGMQMVTILRPDKKLVWMLMPMQQMYQEVSMDSAQAQPGTTMPSDMEISKVGAETVDGTDTTKYKILNKDKSAGGFVWITDDGIPLKMDMLSKADGEKMRMKMTLKDLKIEKQDPALFEIPSGYSKMPAMPGMPGMGGAGGMGGMHGGMHGH